MDNNATRIPGASEPQVLKSMNDLNQLNDLKIIDREFERLRKDTENILSNRLKDASNAESNKFRLSIVPRISCDFNKKEIREKKLEQIMQVPSHTKIPTGIDTAIYEMDQLWNQQDALMPNNLLKHLIQFFEKRISALVYNSYLLLNRGLVLVHHNQELMALDPQGQFVAQYENMHLELDDVVERYHRLMALEDSKTAGNKNDPLTKSPSMQKSIEMGDLKYYAQNMCNLYRERREFDTYIARISNLTTTDLEELVLLVYENYNLPHSFRSKLPIKKPLPLELINEYENVLSWFNLDTTIEQDDGHALAFRCHQMFADKFDELKATPAITDLGNIEPMTLGDKLIKNLESQRNSAFMKTGMHQSTMKLVKASWNLFSELRHVDAVAQDKKERIDFQLRFEYDLIACDKIATVRDHLRSCQKHLAAHSTHRRDKDAHQNGDYQYRPDTTAIFQKTSILGMLIPPSEGGITQMMTKRKRLAELNIALEDPSAVKLSDVHMPKQNEMDPSVIFNSHEIFAFLQLRYLKTRELRLILLRQLNFFRSIERRLDQDTKNCPYKIADQLDPLSFEAHLGLNTGEKLTSDWVHDLNQALGQQTLCNFSEDKRTIIHTHIYVSNVDGNNIVYDVAYSDLQDLETQLLQTASASINLSGKSSDNNQKDQMENNSRSKFREQRELMNVSFTAPTIDRQQILLELYDSAVKFNERKVMLVNALMEVYEHVTWPEDRLALAKHIFKIMYSPRSVMDSSPEGMYKDAMYQMMGLEAQEQLVLGILNSYISKGTPGECSFHHGLTLPIQPYNFFDRIGNFVQVSDMVGSFVNDLSIAVMPFSRVCLPLLEATVWQYMLKQWQSLSDTAFVLPETPRKNLFHMDQMTAPGTLDNMLASIYGAENPDDTLIHPILGNTLPATAYFDETFQDRGFKLCISFIGILKTYRQLKRQWLETHHLNQTLRIQTELLGVSQKEFLVTLSPIPFDEIESGQGQANTVLDVSDEDEHSTRNLKNQQVVSSVIPLAITEFDLSWGNISLEDELTIKRFVKEGPATLSECLKIQILAKLTALTVCETNMVILNRVKERFKMGTEEITSMYTGDLTSVGFFPNQYRRPIRRQMMSMYEEEWKKLPMEKRDKTRMKIKAFSFYTKHFGIFLQDQISRVQLIKVQRLLPESILSGANQTSSSDGTTSSEGNDQPIESAIDIGQGKLLRVFFSLLPMDALTINKPSRVSGTDLSSACSPVNSKLVQLYLFLMEILRLSYVIGNHLNERGDESVRQIVALIKKEILNFGSPLPIDKLINYLLLRWTVLSLQLSLALLSASYCLLASPTLELTMKSFFAVYQSYKKVSSYPESKVRILPCGISQESTLNLNSLSELSLPDRKICSERFNEIQNCLEEIFHLANLESNLLEDALSKQVTYLQSTMILFLLRFEFMAVNCGRQSMDFKMISSFLVAYKSQVSSVAHREFNANQRRKGSFLEDINASRMAQMEFERCQVLTLRNVLTIAYTKSMMRAMKSVFDLLVGERADALFSKRDITVIHQPFLVNGFPVTLREFDFSQKSLLFDEFGRTIQSFSKMTVTDLVQPGLNDGHSRCDLLIVDPRFNLIIRRDLFAEAITTFSNKIANWNQLKWKQIDDFNSQRNSQALDLISQQRDLIQKYTLEQALVQKAYERDVRIGASIKASEIFMELSIIGSELSELKRSRINDEKNIRARVRQEYEGLVAELSSIIHKLKARFNEFKINSVDEMLAAISEVKKDELLAFTRKDYYPKTHSTGKTVIRLQETIDEIRSDNAELKQVMSKIKSMYALKSETSKSLASKTINQLIDDKRAAEESLWESFREGEVRERVLQKDLVTCQKGLVSIQTQYNILEKQLKDEQHANALLRKNISNHQSDNKKGLHKAELYTQFEFEKVINQNRTLTDECASLRLENARLQATLQAQEWRLATKQRLRKSSPVSDCFPPVACTPGDASHQHNFLDMVASKPQSCPSSARKNKQKSPTRPTTARRAVYTITMPISHNSIREEISLEPRAMTATREKVIRIPKNWNL